MKIILSRKGFDSSSGGVPSPILPDGRLLSLPIPSENSPVRYADLSVNGQALGKIVEDLTGGKVRRSHFAHLDPDLRASTYPRLPGWRPLFGQAGIAQGHLERQGVGEGDLFLFFGWFRQTERVNGKYQFVKTAPDLHIIYGWLQIDAVLRVRHDEPKPPEWAIYHPHFHGTYPKNNTIYTSRGRLLLGSVDVWGHNKPHDSKATR
jgi:hypothetical protein